MISWQAKLKNPQAAAVHLTFRCFQYIIYICHFLLTVILFTIRNTKNVVMRDTRKSHGGIKKVSANVTLKTETQQGASASAASFNMVITLS